MAAAPDLNDTIGVFVDAAGVLYIADTFNARIKSGSRQER